MKINALNLNRNIQFRNFQKRTADIPLKNNVLSFNSLAYAQKTDIEISKLQEADFFEEFMDKKGKVTKEEYEDIKKNHPSILLKAQKLVNSFYIGKTTPEEMAEISLAVSEFLNHEFKNYRIISLGTSPAPLCEQLKNLGHDVVFLPVSSLDYSFEKSFETDVLTEYLKSKNIKDKKLNIILDYTSSGHTLNIISDYIKKELKCRRTTKSLSLKTMLHLTSKNTPIHTWNYFEDLFNSSIENISNVPHFPVTRSGVAKYKNADKAGTIYSYGKTKDEIFKEFENYSTPLARCFSLCTMAEIDKMTKGCIHAS